MAKKKWERPIQLESNNRESHAASGAVLLHGPIL